MTDSLAPRFCGSGGCSESGYGFKFGGPWALASERGLPGGRQRFPNRTEGAVNVGGAVLTWLRKSTRRWGGPPTLVKNGYVRKAAQLLGFGLAAMVLVMSGPPRAAAQPPWLTYYADDATIEAFSDYSLLVLDADHHPPLGPLSAQRKLLLGYISLGEVERYRSHFADVKAEGILVQENGDWPGSFYVDLRDPRWTERVMSELVPEILRRGFDGVFLDTLDNAAELERIDPAADAGMTAAAARLVRTIRFHFPKITIMLNRAYEILPMVEQDVDMVLGESVFTDYNFETKDYGRVPAEDYREQVELLQAAMARQPKLRVMTLDYWDLQDLDGIRRIYREQRANGFEPYVSSIELDRIVAEPGK